MKMLLYFVGIFPINNIENPLFVSNRVITNGCGEALPGMSKWTIKKFRIE